MTIATVRRLAADIMNVGRNKVKISPDGLKEAEGALTRSDVKGLIEKGIITKLRPAGRASTARRARRGRGRRRGTPLDSKEVWMQKVRAQRRFLSMLLSSGVLEKGSRREIYMKVKSGIFRNKRAMLLYLKENKLVPEDYEIPKGEAPAEKPRKAPAAKKKGKRREAPKEEPPPKKEHQEKKVKSDD